MYNSCPTKTKWFFKSKDGGPDSNVTGYWLVESKRFGSLALLCFSEGSRENYHNHAFNAISWLLSGRIREHYKMAGEFEMLTFIKHFKPSWKPIVTKRDRLHQVYGVDKKSWALTFRGPWSKTWQEYNPVENKSYTLASGRVIVGVDDGT